MFSRKIRDSILIVIGIAIGLAFGGVMSKPTGAEPVASPIYEYAYGHGILETEGDAITLQVPEMKTVDSEWGKIDVYKTIEFPIAFEGGAQGTEMYAINQIAELGWELVSKYYVADGWEKGHHYWFRRVKG